MDSNDKGFIDKFDFHKLISDNGASIKAFDIEKIITFFTISTTITKGEFLKAIVLPPWKI